ncbi:Uncharacterized protein TCM_022821 [Theobroma cacao]|uniref:Uncharacterized protein n=1 Tax=Theobroma cacao TaxID=3641 RepID=A0A061EUS5_THECC|nr:Uncharacterized protein TCM_022821 [Theobroma cacao]
MYVKIVARTGTEQENVEALLCEPRDQWGFNAGINIHYKWTRLYVIREVLWKENELDMMKRTCFGNLMDVKLENVNSALVSCITYCYVESINLAPSRLRALGTLELSAEEILKAYWVDIDVHLSEGHQYIPLWQLDGRVEFHLEQKKKIMEHKEEKVDTMDEGTSITAEGDVDAVNTDRGVARHTSVDVINAARDPTIDAAVDVVNATTNLIGNAKDNVCSKKGIDMGVDLDEPNGINDLIASTQSSPLTTLYTTSLESITSTKTPHPACSPTPRTPLFARSPTPSEAPHLTCNPSPLKAPSKFKAHLLFKLYLYLESKMHG